MISESLLTLMLPLGYRLNMARFIPERMVRISYRLTLPLLENKMKKSIPDWLVLAMWRALLGEIYPSIRAIAVKFDEDSCLLIRYYLDREPIEMDEESLEVVATNVSASTGPQLVARIEIDCQFTRVPFGALDALDCFIYCRREYDL